MNRIVDILEKAKNRYRYSFILLKELVSTDFKLRYKGSVLGYVWSLLRPLALFAILYFVFVYFLKIGSDIPHYAVYLLFGVVLWNYFTEVTVNGLSAIVSKGDLMRKLYFPRYIIVVAGSFSALINLGINLIVVAIFMIINGVPFTWNILWAIPLIIELFVFSLSIAFLLSALFVKFRDINYIWEVFLQGGFYATPILYPISLVMEKAPVVAKIMMLNPVAQIVQDIRYVVVTPQTLTVATIFNELFIKLIPFAIVIVCAIISVIYFRKKSPGFAEDI